MNKNILGVIPARGGSKGIPKKNIYPLCGKPLIAYSIEEASKSKLLTHCIVSTNSKEIADVSKEYGGFVPFMRPEYLATDKALSVDVVIHSIIEMEKIKNIKYDYAILLQPTTPLRKAEDIDFAIEKIIEYGCDSIVSFVNVGANHPARMYYIKNNTPKPLIDEGIIMQPRQELPPVYIRSGDIYLSRKDIILNKKSMMAGECRSIIIPQERAVNIDDMKDFIIAEYLLKNTKIVDE